jgi:hypothetical protein
VPIRIVSAFAILMLSAASTPANKSDFIVTLLIVVVYSAIVPIQQKVTRVINLSSRFIVNCNSRTQKLA